MSQAAWNRDDLLLLPISSLAYVGDAVYELAVRQYIVRHFPAKSGDLFRLSLAYVPADRQALALEACFADLRPEEQQLCRRARNYAPRSRPRHQDPVDYHKATALEALCGWLWLAGERERMEELIAKFLTVLDQEV